MTTLQPVTEQATDVAVEKIPVVGSKEYLAKKITAFSEGIGPHKITNPFVQARFVREDIFTPAFNMESPDQESFNGGSIINLSIQNTSDIDRMRPGLEWLTNLAASSEEVAVDSVLVGPTGEVVPNMTRNSDSVLIKVPSEQSGENGRDNYVSMTVFWEAKEGCIDKPNQGNGEKMAIPLRNLATRLVDQNSKILLTQIQFITRNAKNSTAIKSSSF